VIWCTKIPSFPSDAWFARELVEGSAIFSRWVSLLTVLLDSSTNISSLKSWRAARQRLAEELRAERDASICRERFQPSDTTDKVISPRI
jgi:hypothetical protein